MRQPVQVLVYPVRLMDSEWNYLLFHRVPLPKLGLPGFWQGVTGGLEGDESLELAAKRELLEETGLVSSQINPIGFSYSFPLQDEWRHLYASGVQEIVEHVFVALFQVGQEPILSSEHDESKWCRKEEALELLKYPGNIEGLKQCAIILESRNNAMHTDADKPRR